MGTLLPLAMLGEEARLPPPTLQALSLLIFSFPCVCSPGPSEAAIHCTAVTIVTKYHSQLLYQWLALHLHTIAQYYL